MKGCAHMKSLRNLTAIGLLVAAACLPSRAEALSVDLQIGWHWPYGEFWDECDPNTQSCQRFVYMDVTNNSANATSAHLYVGNSDGSGSIPPITYAYKATSGWGVVSPNGALDFVTPVPHFTDYHSVTWTQDKRVEQRSIGAYAVLRYILVFQPDADPDDVLATMAFVVKPASYDNDTNTSNNEMGFSTGLCWQSGCDFSAWPL